MKTFLTVTACLFFFSVSLVVQAQQMMRRELSPEQGAFYLKEVQTIFTTENDTVRILTILPKQVRHPDYADIDLRNSDRIIMVNGKRIGHVEELKAIYTALSIGEKLKLGISREGKLTMISIKKINPEELPQNANIKIQMMGDDIEATPWIGTGLMLSDKNEAIEVARKLYDVPAITLREGDEILSINGKKVKKISELTSTYDGIALGEKVTLAFLSEGKEKALSFDKPKTHVRIMARE